MHKLIAALTSLALVASACTAADPEPPSAQPSAPIPTTTSLTVQTTAPATTTTTIPAATAVLLGGIPGDLAASVGALLAAASTGHSANATPAFEEHVVASIQATETPIEFQISTGFVQEEHIAVIYSDGGDVLLGVSPDETTWKIVGGSLPSYGVSPWYGEHLRQFYVIGSDARPGEHPLKFRADSHHIITLWPDGSGGSIVGIPRDTYVETPEGTHGKFTNVMASQGPERVVATATILTGIEFEGYAVTGFKGFVGMIDELGGFEFDAPLAMSDDNAKAYFSAGLQFMTGTAVLAYSRVRKTIAGGDFTRQFHHGLIMQWALKAVQLQGIDALPQNMEIFSRWGWTDLGAEDFLTLSALTFELDPFALTNHVMDGYPASAGGASVVFLEDGYDETFASLGQEPWTPADE
jgi:LCP family protein required for cell wall assembly